MKIIQKIPTEISFVLTIVGLIFIFVNPLVSAVLLLLSTFLIVANEIYCFSRGDVCSNCNYEKLETLSGKKHCNCFWKEK